ncbi:hypothetical protein [Solibacillus daqui]|uniref:hypothetical protein n=1 Tax=Solibacillus daqui TaxID=2912187 RepID=UPI002366EC61|nr:hypothetical protein [Solibacillus daqui]
MSKHRFGDIFNFNLWQNNTKINEVLTFKEGGYYEEKGKIKNMLIILIILLLIAGLILFFLGHYSISFILLGIFVIIITAISNWLQMENEVYIHEKSYKNHNK